MLTRHERDETIRHWNDTPAPAKVLTRCAFGLAVVIGLAVSAAISDAPTTAGMQTAAGSAVAKEVQSVNAQALPQHGLADVGGDNQAAPARPDPRSVSD